MSKTSWHTDPGGAEASWSAAAKQRIDAPVDEVVGRYGLTDRQELRRSIALRGNVISTVDGDGVV